MQLLFVTHYLKLFPTSCTHRNMWKFIKMVISDLDKLISFVRDNQDTTKQLLKEAPNIAAYVLLYNISVYVLLYNIAAYVLLYNIAVYVLLYNIAVYVLLYNISVYVLLYNISVCIVI